MNYFQLGSILRAIPGRKFGTEVTLRHGHSNDKHIRATIKIGDWIVLLSGLAFTGWLASTIWQGGAADKAVIRSHGKIFREVPLSRDQIIEVPGPLGLSKVAIHNGQVRIASDPSPRQYCVRQGWLKHAGEISICLPNQVSVELSGKGKRYDSLNY